MKKLLFATLSYLNFVILAGLVILFVFNEISGIETLVLYLIFFVLIRLIIRWLNPLPPRR